MFWYVYMLYKEFNKDFGWTMKQTINYLNSIKGEFTIFEVAKDEIQNKKYI